MSKSALKANQVAHDVSGAAMIRGTAAGSIVTLALTGQVPAALGVYAAAFAGPAVAGRLLRSKAYLNWLAYARKPGVDHRLALQRLSMIAVRDRDPQTREDLKKLAQAYQQAVQGAQ